MTSWRRQVHVGSLAEAIHAVPNIHVPEMYMTLIRTLKPKSILCLPAPPSHSAYHSPSLLDSKPYHTSSYKPNKMPSSKGEPTDPELREKVKEEVKAEEKGKLSIYLSTYPFVYQSTNKPYSQHDHNPPSSILPSSMPTCPTAY